MMQEREATSDLLRMDLNLLVAFDALIAERSVTRAAARMCVGQPAMSASLSRLRKLFDDPLLVRGDGRTLALTPFAESLADPIRQTLASLERILATRHEFDPAHETRTFTVLASDYVLLVMLSRLVSKLHRQAPGIKINVRPLSTDYAEQVQRGLADLYIIPREIAQSHEAFRSEDLFSDRLVCAVDANNELVGETMTRAQFETLPYIAFDGGAGTSAAQWQLTQLEVHRPIDVTTQSFVVAPLLLRGAPFFTVMHLRLARALGGGESLRIVPPPVPFTPIREAMFWADRNENSRAHQWLRAQMRAAAAELDPIDQ